MPASALRAAAAARGFRKSGFELPKTQQPNLLGARQQFADELSDVFDKF